MKAILTSTFGASVKIDGRRFGIAISEENGLCDKVKEIWPENAGAQTDPSGSGAASAGWPLPRPAAG